MSYCNIGDTSYDRNFVERYEIQDEEVSEPFLLFFTHKVKILKVVGILKDNGPFGQKYIQMGTYKEKDRADAEISMKNFNKRLFAADTIMLKDGLGNYRVGFKQDWWVTDFIAGQAFGNLIVGNRVDYYKSNEDTFYNVVEITFCSEEEARKFALSIEKKAKDCINERITANNRVKALTRFSELS